MADIARAREALEKLMALPIVMHNASLRYFVGLALSHLQDAFAKPYETCPRCGGGGCNACNGLGVIERAR